jgi:hypothetical protein
MLNGSLQYEYQKIEDILYQRVSTPNKPDLVATKEENKEPEN